MQYHRHKRISLLCSEWEEVEQRYHKHLIVSLLPNYTFAFIIMFVLILKYNLITGVSIAIHTEMTTGIVHAYILAYHTTTNLTLALVFQIPWLRRNWGYFTKYITFRQLTYMEIINKLFVVCENTFH